MATQQFIFDEERHRYVYDGKTVRGVTGLIRDGFDARGEPFISPETIRRFTEEARWRGTRVHKACLDIDLGVYDHQPLVEDAGCVQSYLEWRHLAVPRWTVMEEVRFSRRYRFCGIADRVGFDGRARPIVLDFKTGVKQKWHAIQLALYDILHDDVPW